MSRKRGPRVMVDFFPLSRLKKLHAEGTPPHWRACHELPFRHIPEHMCLEYERPDGTGDYGGIHVARVVGSRDIDVDLPLLAAGRNALPHLIAAIEAAFMLESRMQGAPGMAALSRALNVFRERKRVTTAGRGVERQNGRCATGDLHRSPGNPCRGTGPVTIDRENT